MTKLYIDSRKLGNIDDDRDVNKSLKIIIPGESAILFDILCIKYIEGK